MTRTSVQILKMAAESWHLQRLTEVWKGAFEYEVIGRVIREGDLYRVDLVRWTETGREWARQPRGYLIPRAAFRAIVDYREYPT